MKHGHGTTNDSPRENPKRRDRAAVDAQNAEANRRRAPGRGTPNQLGVTQGQNAEQGNTVEPRNAMESGKIRH